MREPLEPGYLLNALGYDEEAETAAGIGITPQTLVKYRKAGMGPPYLELAGKIFYAREAVGNWLAAGGTRPRNTPSKSRRRDAHRR